MKFPEANDKSHNEQNARDFQGFEMMEKKQKMVWGYSSVGRMLAYPAGNLGFDPT